MSLTCENTEKQIKPTNNPRKLTLQLRLPKGERENKVGRGQFMVEVYQHLGGG